MAVATENHILSSVHIPIRQRGFEPISHRGALLSALLHAILYVVYTIC
jgi:hypothetical protein